MPGGYGIQRDRARAPEFIHKARTSITLSIDCDSQTQCSFSLQATHQYTHVHMYMYFHSSCCLLHADRQTELFLKADECVHEDIFATAPIWCVNVKAIHRIDNFHILQGINKKSKKIFGTEWG